MRAFVQRAYGPMAQIRLEERPVPTPGPAEAVVDVRAAGVDPSIWHLMTGTPYLVRVAFGLTRPRIPTPGWDAAGVVRAIGPEASDLAVGDRVFGTVRGAFAECAVSRTRNLQPIPPGLTFDQAAAVPTSGVTALQAVRDSAKVARGEKVAIIGAGGGVGSFAVQLAAAAGAQVTGVCSTGKVDFVRSLGAASVVDYTTSDLTTDGDRFDAIIDCAGARPLRSLRRILASDGTMVMVGAESERAQLLGVGRALRAAMLSLTTRQRLRPLFASVRTEDLATLAQLLDSGALRVPLDRVFGFEEAIDAVHHVQQGRPLGKVVVRVSATQ